MSDRTQIGPAVDADLWHRFRQDVKARKGTIRGNLGAELETAIRQYVEGGDPTSAGTLDERLARIENSLGIAGADGGAYTSEAETHTHAPTPAPAEKPAANAATDKKVAWLAQCILDDHGATRKSLAELPEATIRDAVKEAYGFRRDTARRYVEMLVEHFGLVQHPNTDDIYVTPARRDEIAGAQADDRMDDLTEP